MAHQGNIQVAPRVSPLVNERRLITLPWLGYLLRTFVGGSEPGTLINLIDDVPVAPDSFTYEASIPGSLLIQGGTMSVINLIRGRLTINLGGSFEGFIPMGLKDRVLITYSVIPTAVWFLPAVGVQQGVM